MTVLQTQQFERELHHVLTAGAGCMTLIILGPKSSIALLRDVEDGDMQAIGVLDAANKALRRIHRRSRAAAMSCWLCGSSSLWRQTPPSALALVVPLGVVPIRAVVAMAFCGDCTAAYGEDERRLGAVAVQKIREGMLPDLRVLPAMTQQVGHA
jgi:hypothetical protein